MLNERPQNRITWILRNCLTDLDSCRNTRIVWSDIMKTELYFTLRLTENEHYIVEDMIQTFCNQTPGVILEYYRRFKTGHVPMQREVKITGDIGKFLKFARDTDLPMENYWQTELNGDIEA